MTRWIMQLDWIPVSFDIVFRENFTNHQIYRKILFLEIFTIFLKSINLFLVELYNCLRQFHALRMKNNHKMFFLSPYVNMKK